MDDSWATTRQSGSSAAGAPAYPPAADGLRLCHGRSNVRDPGTKTSSSQFGGGFVLGLLYANRSSYTRSISSSVVDYPVEYGRRYHAFRQGAYSFPNDETEMHRLDMTHTLMFKSIGYKLYLAPIQPENVQRILDVGTGTGLWSIEMGDLFPNAEVVGNDLSAIQPDWLPSNVKFVVDDVESEWIDPKKYDYIFVRYMLVAIADWPKLVANIFDHLNPGGWVEFQDMDGKYYSDDGTYTEEHAMYQWNKKFIEACEAMGRTARPGPQLEGWVRHAGFQNVVHRRFKVPIGPWPRDPHFKDVGMLNLVQLLEGLEGFSLKVFCGFLGQSEGWLRELLGKVREEMKSAAVHAMFDQ
ncbi:methyltransferase domain-containing protein [Colletotrichum truncatum]|uniref:Methyltransferase domain-containing protein n=1 Tax=Colletotrichum truncatum TaxID=5467 RepID=A0ACC3Z6Q9_COLTU